MGPFVYLEFFILTVCEIEPLYLLNIVLDHHIVCCIIALITITVCIFYFTCAVYAPKRSQEFVARLPRRIPRTHIFVLSTSDFIRTFGLSICAHKMFVLSLFRYKT